ncbi:ADM_HP2_G0043620.mRNA.1.CDS.1 [Saccharomyces cerevisiae]|nr:ADM_HP2_G0043620.mRNA.1.CDS.1 [Saccharomyces cerevisiae]CAI6747140.1 ADM_HP2_G0043620.mRNA.1.CDS.1 [Saccharomyces cerevisiae]
MLRLGALPSYRPGWYAIPASSMSLVAALKRHNLDHSFPVASRREIVGSRDPGLCGSAGG